MPWTAVSVSPRKSTDRTTVRPPYAATTGLTTASGPIRSAVKNDRYAPAAITPKIEASRQGERVGGQSDALADRQPERDDDAHELGDAPRLAGCRAGDRASDAMTSVEPQHSAAIRPWPSPSGIGQAYGPVRGNGRLFGRAGRRAVRRASAGRSGGPLVHSRTDPRLRAIAPVGM